MQPVCNPLTTFTVFFSGMTGRIPRNSHSAYLMLPSYPLSMTQVPGVKPRRIVVSSRPGMCSCSESQAVATVPGKRQVSLGAHSSVHLKATLK